MISAKDLKIISNLRRNARMSLTKMSKKTSIPVSTIFDRLRLHEKEFIKKHTTLIDFSKLGFNIRANVMIKANKENRDAAKEYLMKHQNVNSLYKINNGYDFLIEGIFKHIKDLEDFSELLEEKFNITEQQTYHVIDDIKKEEFMAEPELLDIIIADKI